nr:hypothetical protein [Solirubrobacterales bacterium]
LRFRAELEAAGVDVAPEADPRHRVRAAATCRLARAAEPDWREEVLPQYLRLPDAELALRPAS